MSTQISRRPMFPPEKSSSPAPTPEVPSTQAVPKQLLPPAVCPDMSLPPAETEMLTIPVQPEPSSCSSSPSPPRLNKPRVPLVSVQELALNLLRSGSFPLLPPGRREWASVPEKSCPLAPNLRWPPSGWQSMSSDMKLFSVEWADITLETTWTGRTRTELVLLYNNLVLSGTTLVPDCPITAAYIANYQLIRKIATSKQTCPGDEELVAVFEGGCPARLSPRINAQDVPLRPSCMN